MTAPSVAGEASGARETPSVAAAMTPLPSMAHSSVPNVT